MKIASRIEKVTPSLTLEITSLAKKMRQQGNAVINFAAGEPDFDTPDYIKEFAIEAIRSGFTKYTPSTGIPELKQVISKKLKRDNQLHYLPSQIIVCCGAKHALYNILQVLCEKNDRVIIPSPYWVSYPQMVNLAEANPQIIKTHSKDDFKINVRSLERTINSRTKVLILNSPANPTGSVYSRAQLQKIADIAIKKNLYVISDEIYEKLIFDGKQHISIASLNKRISKRTIVVNGVSKTYAMTGWRIGYLACTSEKIIKAISNLQSHSTSNPCSVSQKAAWQALNNTSQAQIQKINREFQRRRDALLKGLDKISALSYFKPAGAFYVFCNISKLGLGSLKFSRRLLQEAKIAVVPGIAFGYDNYVRVSFATGIQQIEEGVRRIKDWVNKNS